MCIILYKFNVIYIGTIVHNQDLNVKILIDQVFHNEKINSCGLSCLMHLTYIPYLLTFIFSPIQLDN